MSNLLDRTKKLCHENNIVPARSKGQNFLVNETVYEKITQAAGLGGGDKVIEVGPGLGFLTEKLAASSQNVIAVELDDKLAGVLKKKLDEQGVGNVEVLNEDVLELLDIETGNCPPEADLSQVEKLSALGGKIGNRKLKKAKLSEDISCAKNEIFDQKYKIVANLPYNITSIFLRKVYELENKPELMVLMLQREVAERIAAGPGKMSKLAVMCQLYAEPEIILSVPKSDFWPSPEVGSAVIRLVTRGMDDVFSLNAVGNNINNKDATSPLPPSRRGTQKDATAPLPPSPPSYEASDGRGRRGTYQKEFFQLLRIGFAQKRKMLRNNLANGYHISTKEAGEWLERAGFGPNTRAQELGVGDWMKLFTKHDVG